MMLYTSGAHLIPIQHEGKWWWAVQQFDKNATHHDPITGKLMYPVNIAMHVEDLIQREVKECDVEDEDGNLIIDDDIVVGCKVLHECKRGTDGTCRGCNTWVYVKEYKKLPNEKVEEPEDEDDDLTRELERILSEPPF